MSGLPTKPSSTLFISIVVSSALCGVLTVQTHQYLFRFPKDPRWLKWMVIVLWVLDTVHQILECIAVYRFMVGAFPTKTTLAEFPWQALVAHLIQPITAFVVQLYFCRQLYRLNRPLWPVVVVAVGLALVSFVAGMTGAIVLYAGLMIGQFGPLARLEMAWLLPCAACDILIALSISWSLWRNRSGLRSTDRLITKLIVWTVSTGAITALFAELELLSFKVARFSRLDPLMTFAFDIVLAKLYANSLLTFLNRRHSEKDASVQPRTTQPDIMMTTFELGTRPPLEVDITIAPTSPQESRTESGTALTTQASNISDLRTPTAVQGRRIPHFDTHSA